MPNFDLLAHHIVRKYVNEHLNKSDGPVEYDIYTVWKCKILQNWKWLISTSLPYGMYYEVIYNGDRGEFYLDAYQKFEHQCIRLMDICGEGQK